MELHEAPAVYEHVIHYDEEKQTQVRVTVNTFRSVEYLSVRKYYMDFNEEYGSNTIVGPLNTPRLLSKKFIFK